MTVRFTGWEPLRTALNSPTFTAVVSEVIPRGVRIETISAAGADGRAEGENMRAHTRDWLVIRSHTDSTASRWAEIIAVPSPDGQPPHTVRWEDSGHEGVVFPGPDAQVVTGS